MKKDSELPNSLSNGKLKFWQQANYRHLTIYKLYNDKN